tara:strand:- start:45 stop:749 length:705 start_codon:yes stop_codon:yes gene_type:complete
MKALTILFILTSHSTMGSTGDETGLWLEEFTTPYYAFADAGYDIDIASIEGGAPPIDPRSLEGEDKPESILRYEKDTALQEALNNSVAIQDVNASTYAAVIIPGGHGTMWDLPNNERLSDIISSTYQDGRVVAAVCHGPAGLIGPVNADGAPIVKGKKVAGFTNAEEEAVELTDVVPFLLEDKLIELGAHYQKGPDFEPFAIADGNLVTGQNPASSKKVAEFVIEILESKKGNE